MLTLLLLRHAKAEPATPGVADIDRALADRGRVDAPRMGAYLSEHKLVPDLIICSTARRTRETLDLVVPELGAVVPSLMEAAIYEASVARLLGVIRKAPAMAHRLMLVGHNPGFEDLASDLMRTADKDAESRFDKKYPTSGLAVLTFDIDAWAKLTPRTGTLVAFTAPRYLK